MIDFKKYPNEVILWNLIPIANKYRYYLDGEAINTKNDHYNTKFYEMLQAISNPNLDKVYHEKYQKLRSNFAQNKSDFETQYKNGLIDLDTLMAEVATLNISLKETLDAYEREHSTFGQIQTILIQSLETFDRFSMYGFNAGAPLVSKNKYIIQVLSKGYITEIDSSKDYESYEFCYAPEYKEKFDKLLGKTKTDEKTK